MNRTTKRITKTIDRISNVIDILYLGTEFYNEDRVNEKKEKTPEVNVCSPPDVKKKDTSRFIVH